MTAKSVDRNQSLLRIQGLSVSLPKGMDRQFAVEDISFELNHGEILCIIGESGSGKSVTANAIMGLLPSSLEIRSGEIRLGSLDLRTAAPRVLRDIRGRIVSIVFQDPLSALNPLMTIGAQIMEVMAAHATHAPKDRTTRVVELLREVGLPNPEALQHQYPFRLSGGQRQRVMIAMALALEPDILIADEPTTALDVTTQAQILELIAGLQRRKRMGVMFITHDFGVVADIADRVIVMQTGRVVEQGLAKDVLKAPQHPYTQRLVAAVPRMRTANRAAQADAPAILTVSNLSKNFILNGGLFASGNTIRAVDDVSFSIAAGQTVGIVGESGSGKSTLGRLVMKLTDADEGTIVFDGQDVARMPESRFRALRPQIQMIFQDPFASLNPRMTIGGILTAGPRAHGMSAGEAEEKAKQLLSKVGLDPGAFERFPHEFSGGQRQRIGIARALMFDPKLIVADEAVSALDVSIQAQILDLLEQVQRDTRVAMMFITHDLRVASRLCDQVAVMHRGKMVEFGPPTQIFHAPQHDYTRLLVSAIPGADWDAAA
ncbi:ABC transporter ATP-binding protein [Aureimonas altamirensis]|uniref:ABC transporter ATP-binding protein n=1 Tax=Aureimonas altamirensis TaxID=370622 RepID=UPI001E31C452|nr:ABC transporter ATP-binding protein [Aureimonas altamirensis]UHD43876.1 ABC transporter ATP-binding protein [Aureimonas altamirensis]